MTFDLESLVRPNIRRLRPYSSARSEFSGSAEIFLDANENAFGSPAGKGLNRYPDPLQLELKNRFATLRGVDESQIFVGNGSDEAIDLLFRIFCRPGLDECIVCPPTYGMYQVSADINDIRVVEVPLTPSYQLATRNVIQAITDSTRLIFICSPNNPTGNLMRTDDVFEILKSFEGLVVVDEAYIDFADQGSIVSQLRNFPNLIVLQTLSKAWGLAGLRIGAAFASPQIVSLMNRAKPPYNISSVAQSVAISAFDRRTEVEANVASTIDQREKLRSYLLESKVVIEVSSSDANFLLVKVDDADKIYKALLQDSIVVRDRSSVIMCEGCLRITVGTEEENQRLLSSLKSI